MSNLTSKSHQHNLKLELFSARCDVRAELFRRGELSLHDAVDILQQWAAEYLIPDSADQDEIQHIIAKAFDQRRRG